MAKKEEMAPEESVQDQNANIDEESSNVEQVVPEEKASAEEESSEEENKELTDEDRIVLLEAEIEKLKEENSSLKDQYLRKHADFENFRRRMNKEKQDSIKYGNSGLLKDLIEVIDNFERAIKTSAESDDLASFREGIAMIEQHFTSMLSSKWGLEKIEAVGQEFDANLHEALMMEDSEDVEVTTVVEDFQTGYKLHDRILRPTKVKVAKPAAKDAT
ncbi:nucleotide exchange factor GrpE [Spirochaeta isovalerica]|uniref:Protein GrpE n=1 Tax=Spirochaeta isovalerica TaxID=150 RepID=A0A841RF65_9SPIO|nr:nucleotide exchange factor GrpE [Spirochaeta isovalerica]MBB6482246.1 molecular chaperone GrpE [Spirochaeta isovalerica]